FYYDVEKDTHIGSGINNINHPLTYLPLNKGVNEQLLFFYRYIINHGGFNPQNSQLFEDTFRDFRLQNIQTGISFYKREEHNKYLPYKQVNEKLFLLSKIEDAIEKKIISISNKYEVLFRINLPEYGDIKNKLLNDLYYFILDEYGKKKGISISSGLQKKIKQDLVKIVNIFSDSLNHPLSVNEINNFENSFKSDVGKVFSKFIELNSDKYFKDFYKDNFKEIRLRVQEITTHEVKQSQKYSLNVYLHDLKEEVNGLKTKYLELDSTLYQLYALGYNDNTPIVAQIKEKISKVNLFFNNSVELIEKSLNDSLENPLHSTFKDILEKTYLTLGDNDGNISLINGKLYTDNGDELSFNKQGQLKIGNTLKSPLVKDSSGYGVFLPIQELKTKDFSITYDSVNDLFIRDDNGEILSLNSENQLINKQGIVITDEKNNAFTINKNLLLEFQEGSQKIWRQLDLSGHSLDSDGKIYKVTINRDKANWLLD
ncbi:hypothetical protein, partial [Geminocystis sp. GBBB08]|uniref:hypothetical protein n=1 Tax=Geminocystis sp. GBBB08 TaxID=2604140 RepID=UPI0027E365F7